MDGKLIILGCGGSAGVPAIGNWWGDCDPNEPKNIRTRPSIALKTKDKLVIVDTGPDFRIQMNREKLGAPDAVIITHTHFDHVNGIDELRTFQRQDRERTFPTYGLRETLESLQKTAGYMFRPSENGFYRTVCMPHEVNAGKIVIQNIPMQLFEQEHGTMPTLGIRIGNVAYSTDVKRLHADALKTLAGVDTWIVDGAGHHRRENPVHACIEEIVEMNAQIGAKKVFLTHLPPVMDYQTLVKELPDNFAPAYDGLVIDFTAA